MKCKCLESWSLYLSNGIFYIVIGHLHIRVYTFEDMGVERFLDLEYICMGCIACLVSGVMLAAECNTAACTNARRIMHVCKGRNR